MTAPKVSPRWLQASLPQKEGRVLPRDAFPKGTQLGPLLLFLGTKFRAPRAVEACSTGARGAIKVSYFQGLQLLATHQRPHCCIRLPRQNSATLQTRNFCGPKPPRRARRADGQRARRARSAQRSTAQRTQDTSSTHSRSDRPHERPTPAKTCMHAWVDPWTCSPRGLPSTRHGANPTCIASLLAEVGTRWR